MTLGGQSQVSMTRLVNPFERSMINNHYHPQERHGQHQQQLPGRLPPPHTLQEVGVKANRKAMPTKPKLAHGAKLSNWVLLEINHSITIVFLRFIPLAHP
jgi:hypothetical protein